MKRRVVRVLIGLLVVVVVLAAVATWVLSGKINAGALEVSPPSRSDDVRVVSVDGSLVVVDDSSHPHDALSRGFRYGLRWKGGWGVVQGPAAEGDEHKVRLTMRVLDGKPPRAGAGARALRDVYDERTQIPGLRAVTYDAGGHRFPAYLWRPSRGGDDGRWAVLVHGKGGTPLEMVRMARDMVAAGRTALLIGYRNDAGAWKDPSGEYGYGTTEWRDLRGALAWAAGHGARDVMLGGASMGGAVVASYLEHVPSHRQRRPAVTGVVLDAPMLDLGATVAWGARGVPKPLTWAAERVAGLRFGLDWQATDRLDDTGWADVPVLVLHGDDDPTAPVALSRDLADKDPDVRVEEFPRAGHVESWNSDPPRYDRLVRDFATGQK